MTIIENVNFWLTIISIIVTLVSIGFSIWSFSSAKSAKRYKDDVVFIKDTVELKKLMTQFLIESSTFQTNTRCTDWYKGIDVNIVISPFSEVLRSFGSVYYLFDSVDEIRSKIHTLYNYVQEYDKATRAIRKECNAIILDISDLLHRQMNANTTYIIHN